ncbi:MAG: hypothetical protein K5898_15960 [Ruminococcus sp.]|uniref:hypothetical protein n=1 Tax=Ruminococcus sp. TaxID=41978 RepID=UPI0025F2FF5F|nr:hypothetical protein [Ruminococcus sp.]MCR4796634.1 hypothetical protein [Ruminococcus sp.]
MWIRAYKGNISVNEARVPGGKHSFAHSIAVGALADEVFFTNVPVIRDSIVMIELLKEIFGQVIFDRERHTLFLAEKKTPSEIVITEKMLKQSRNIFCIMPALLSRAEKLVIKGEPKGCNIGERPTDWYYDIMKRFGASYIYSDDAIEITWREKKCADISFEYPTMTGTVIAYACACASTGTSIIRNCSEEQSCDDEIDCIRECGIKVEGDHSAFTIINNGMNEKVTFKCRCDRIYAATLLSAAILAGRSFSVYSDDVIRIPRYIEFAKNIGLEVIDEGSRITVKNNDKLGPAIINAGSEPKYSSDWVPFAMLILAVKVKGVSVITDDVFIKRGQFINCYHNKNNFANIEISETVINGRKAMKATINGNGSKRIDGGGTDLCEDIRGTAGIVLSAIVSENNVEVSGDFQLSRGYEDLIGDLKKYEFIEEVKAI